MRPRETRQSGGTLLPLSFLRGGGVFLDEVSRRRKRKRDILVGTWNVRGLYRAGSLTAVANKDGPSGSGTGLWGLDGVGSG
jgi:hypothetical protein